VIAQHHGGRAAVMPSGTDICIERPAQNTRYMIDRGTITDRNVISRVRMQEAAFQLAKVAHDSEITALERVPFLQFLSRNARNRVQRNLWRARGNMKRALAMYSQSKVPY
jgi:hypothetical protein